MFGLFNKNKTFAPLATDMHCHLLPGVDDGSSNISETISCLKTLYSVGFKKIYFTPHFQAHYPNNEEDIKQRFAELKKTLEKEKIDDMPEVIDVAGEYRFDDKFARIPGVDNVLTLPGKRLLCEFSLHFNNFSPLSLFEEYIKMGYANINSGNIFTKIFDSAQESCVFSIKFKSATKGEFNIISLDKIKSRNMWQEIVEYTGSIEDATSFKVEDYGICEKYDDVTWQVTKKLKIKLQK